MREEDILKAIGQVDDRFLIDAQKKKRGHFILRVAAMAASIALIVACGLDVVDRMDIGRAGCSATLGDIANGKYYYYKMHEGVFSYDITNGETKKELNTFFMQGYEVDDYGLFYDMHGKLYVKAHETGKTRKIFSVNPLAINNMIYELTGTNEDILITVYCKNETVYQRVIDAVTGKDVSENYPDIYYDNVSFDDFVNREDVTYSLGDRKFVYHNENIKTENGWAYDDYFAEYTPDGSFQKIDYGEAEFVFVKYYDDDYIVVSYEGEYDRIYGGYIFTSDGRTIELDRKAIQRFENIYGSVNECLIYGNETQKYVYSIPTGESTKFKLYDESKDNELDEKTYENLYTLLIDKDIVFSCAPWSHEQRMWKLLYMDDGRTPYGAYLVDEFD